MHSLTNVPTANMDRDYEIAGIIDGPDVRIVCRRRHPRERDAIGDCVTMTTTLIGDHMLANPQMLREMYARDLATAIRMGRDAGYHQAKAEIRSALGITTSAVL